MKQADIDKLITQALRSRPEAEREDDIQQILRQNEREAWQMAVDSRRQKVWMKAAAMFIGVLFVSAISFAAIHIVSLTSQRAHPQPLPKGGEPQSQIQTHVQTKGTPLPLGGAGGGLSPVIFDNVPLSEMLPEIAQHYGLTVQFQNENVRNLRFYFKWNPAAPVTKVVEELNMFEQVNLKLNDQTITAE